MLSGKVRWQQVGLFALFALVPAASVSVLGLSAVSTTEITAQREVAAMLGGAAARTSRTIELGLRAAEEALGRAGEEGGMDALEADVRRAAPPFADAVVLGADGRFLLPKPASVKPAAHDPACDTAAEQLARAGDKASRREARRRILTDCKEARTASARHLWPLAAIDALRDGEGGGAALAEWLEGHAGDLSTVERRATLLDVRQIEGLPAGERERIEAALTGPPSRLDELSEELSTNEARRALERAKSTQAVVPFKGATSVGAFRRLASGAVAGFIVHEASLAEALAARRIELPEDVRAEVKAGLAVSSLALDTPAVVEVQDPARAAGRRSALVPAATAEVAPLLVVRLFPKDPGIVARQARRSRLVLGGVGVGSTLLACLLALAIYRRMRDVERSSDLRTDFVSAVSHELRTPIASVRMLAELLEQGRVEPEEQAEVFTAIAAESRRLGATVDRLLGFSRMAAGRYRVERAPGRLAEPISEAIDAFEERSPGEPRVVRRLDASIEGEIDAGQLRLAIDNLLANARKYAPDGGPYEVTLERDEGGARVGVKDRGPGIARGDRERIFEPFERADDRLSRATDGSGIGLALVAHVARAHGGRAWVESEPGRGATFWIWIEAAEKSA
ncbi:MAG: HAMP domain-containing sensor histidine kinase [Polyangiaceae bacterium]